MINHEEMLSHRVVLKKNYKRFGKLQINLLKLYDKILMVAYITGSPFLKIKTRSISEDLSTILIDIIETEGKNEINDDIFGRLSEEERGLFKEIIDSSGLRPLLKLKERQRTIPQCIARFKVLQGAIDAGNDNKELIKEAINLMQILVLAGKISKEEGDEIIESLKEEMK